MDKIGGSNNRNNKGNNVGKRSRRKKNSEGNDYISHLPEAIILHILSFLPLKELVAVSLLSRLWKSMVLTLISVVPSNLNLDELDMMGKYICRREICYPGNSHGHIPYSAHQSRCYSIRAARRKFEQFVERTLLLHTGCTIERLRLSICYDAESEYTKRIDRWVQFSLRNDVRHLELNFSRGKLFRLRGWDKIYELPHGNFAPKNLKSCILNYCKLKLSIFAVFGSLQTLYLKQVKIIDCSIATIGELVAKCPTLEDLFLEYCVIPNDFMVSDQDMKIKRLVLIHCKTDEWPMFPIEISAPELLILTIVGRYLMTSSVRKALQLAEVLIDIPQKYADHVQGDALGSLLTSLNHCQTLALSTWCIQVLPTGENLLQQLPIQLLNLRHLRMAVGWTKQEFPGIACLLRSCPNMERLTLDMFEPVNVDWAEFEDDIPIIFDFEEHSYWQSQNLPFQCLQYSLKTVEVNGFAGRSNEMQMIQFLLENARVLEKMAIFFIQTQTSAASTQQQNNHMQLQNNSLQLLNFPRASSQAQIEIFGNPYNNIM
ncbi:putative F-box/LRR-repeat protein At5g54820 [Fagus crenata]